MGEGVGAVAEAGLGIGAAGVFPFGFGGETVGVVGGDEGLFCVELGEALAELGGIAVADAFDGAAGVTEEEAGVDLHDGLVLGLGDFAAGDPEALGEGDLGLGAFIEVAVGFFVGATHGEVARGYPDQIEVTAGAGGLCRGGVVGGDGRVDGADVGWVDGDGWAAEQLQREVLGWPGAVDGGVRAGEDLGGDGVGGGEAGGGEVGGGELDIGLGSGDAVGAAGDLGMERIAVAEEDELLVGSGAWGLGVDEGDAGEVGAVERELGAVGGLELERIEEDEAGDAVVLGGGDAVDLVWGLGEVDGLDGMDGELDLGVGGLDGEGFEEWCSGEGVALVGPDIAGGGSCEGGRAEEGGEQEAQEGVWGHGVIWVGRGR
ncbi:MAG: hypothetical protein RI897_793 [Verrucomicrobiota bacterium]